VKTLKITTHWTVEEADCIYQFLGDFQSAIWEGYGDGIEQMYSEIKDDQQAREKTFFDDIRF
jgi:hypothetical protein